MASCMVRNFFFFFFLKSSDNLPLKTYIKQKSTSKEVPREKLTEKNFYAVSGQDSRPNSRHKNFVKISIAHVFLHWRVETSGKLKAKDQS